MTKEEIRIKIIEAYQIYKKNLNNRNFMYIFKNKKIDGISIEFKKENFPHLIGLKKYKNKQIINNLDNNALAYSDYRIDKFTEIKLNNFIEIVKFKNSVELYIGNHNLEKSIKLKVEKLIGDESISLGISRSLNGTYYPKSFLKESVEIRAYKEEVFKIIGIFEKDINKEKYNKLNYFNENYKDEIFSNSELLTTLESKEIIIEVIKINSDFAKEISEEFQNDEEIIDEVIKENRKL